MNDYGNTGAACSHADEGMFTSSTTPTAESPYLGYLLAGNPAQPGARLTALALSPSAASSSVLAFQSVLSAGKAAVLLNNTLLNNTSTSAQQRVTFRSALSGKGGVNDRWRSHPGPFRKI